LSQKARIVSYVSADLYVDEMRKPYFAPFVFDSAPIDGVLGASPIRGEMVYFIDGTTSSVDALRAALVRPGRCYVTVKRAAKLLQSMADEGYISMQIAQSPLVRTTDSLVIMLQQAGNEVFVLDTERHSLRNSTSGEITSLVNATDIVTEQIMTREERYRNDT